MNKDYPAGKLTQNDLDLFDEEYKKKLIPAGKLYNFLNELYERFRKNTFEEMIAPNICDMDSLKKAYDSRMEPLEQNANMLQAELMAQVPTNLSILAREQQGLPVSTLEREKAVAETEKIKAKLAVVFSDRDKEKERYIADLHSLEALRVSGQDEIKKYRSFFRKLTLRFKLIRFSANLFITAFNLVLAWKMDELAERTERSKPLDKHLPDFLHEHFWFFLFFFSA